MIAYVIASLHDPDNREELQLPDKKGSAVHEQKPSYEDPSLSTSSSGDEESTSEEEDDADEQYFAVRAVTSREGSTPVDRDVIESRCKELRKLMRERPTLPVKADGAELTSSDLRTGVQLPL